MNRRPVTPQDAALAARVRFDLDAPPRTSDSDKPVKGGPGLPVPSAQPPSLRHPTPEYLAGLPTDPAQLLALLCRAAKAGGNAKWSTDKIAFRIVGDLFAECDPSIQPTLRAGPYRAIALIPGIQRIEGRPTSAAAGASLSASPRAANGRTSSWTRPPCTRSATASSG
ncbi:hypothetical protein Nm8I071_37200 [Nonomuraea sp. TT08I-71]|nr:hypothetical protein Nm8I071_37200 [Nonomuraea sp. TT08I-71]